MYERLRILIVEDSDEKYQRVNDEVIKRQDNVIFDIERSRSFASANSTLERKSYDVVVLDLVLPSYDGGLEKSDQFAIDLVNLIKGGGLFRPSHIIGLTEHAKIADTRKDFFEESLLALEIYSTESFVWADRLGAKLNYIAQSRLASFGYHFDNFDYDLLVVCAVRETEFNPIVKSAKWLSKPSRTSPFLNGVVVATGLIEVGGTQKRAAMVCANDMGIAYAGPLASNAISIFRPRVIAMLGMCCGFKTNTCISPSKIGDLIVVRETACWQDGKYTESPDGKQIYMNRSRPLIADAEAEAVVTRLIKNSKQDILPGLVRHYKNGVARGIYKPRGQKAFVPEIKYGFMLTGASLVASGQKVEEILKLFPSAISLDMEMYGVFAAARNALGGRPWVVGIKGVADYGTVKKNKKAQAHVSVASYMVLSRMLKDMY